MVPWLVAPPSLPLPSPLAAPPHPPLLPSPLLPSRRRPCCPCAVRASPTGESDEVRGTKALVWRPGELMQRREKGQRSRPGELMQRRKKGQRSQTEARARPG
eukprot:1858973-Prymnesium_polylepis.2